MDRLGQTCDINTVYSGLSCGDNKQWDDQPTNFYSNKSFFYYI